MRPSASNPVLLLTLGIFVSGCGGGSAGESGAPAPITANVISSSPSAQQAAPIGSINAPAALVTPALVPSQAPPESEALANPAPAAPPPQLAPVADAPAPPKTHSNEGRVITDVVIHNTSAVAQVNVPMTFGHVFAPGDVTAASAVSGKWADGSDAQLQVNVKASHPDGSLRHAIISASLSQLPASSSATLTLLSGVTVATTPTTPPTALLDAGFSANVDIDVGGQRYSASADALLRSGQYKTWLSGAVSNEWLVSTPLKTAAGVAHPHLSARFAVRASGSQRARVDVTIENNWAFEAAPQTFVYDAQVLIGGQNVFTKAALRHFHHARWRKVFWWGGEPQIHIKHNIGYLIASKAVPNYDRGVKFTEAKLASYKSAWSGTKVEPMGVGMVNPYMPSTGGRDEIGIMPAWYATYLLTMDKRVKDATLGSGDLAGSWSSHYRDRVTDRPLSLAQYPYATVWGKSGDTFNPVTKKYEAFPVCATATACDSPYSHDTSHQPGFAYVPYLVTGDHYYLEELQFWSMFNLFASNPAYRDTSKGLIKGDQVRGQAWSLRTLGEAAYITPDADPLKADFRSFVKSNIDWYDANYTNNADALPFGALTNGYALAYTSSTGLAPWQDDFFTAAVGHVVELGFSQAKPLLQWKSKFPIARMTSTDACWVTGALYSLKVRDTATSPFYTTYSQAWKASHTPEFGAMACSSQQMATSLQLKVAEMTGYSTAWSGYPSNMQPALAYAADTMAPQGAAAWSVFMSRSVKPDYGLGPQFAIIPR